MEVKSFSKVLGGIIDAGIWNAADRVFKIVSWSAIVAFLKAISSQNDQVLVVYNICFFMLFISIGNASTTLVKTVLELVSSLFNMKPAPLYIIVILFFVISAPIFYFSNFIFIHNIEELINEYVKNFKPR